MYEQFYGFREKPFNLTPDPSFLYLSEKHKEAFAHLLYGIRNRSGFIMVTGEIGTGKTTICRSLLSRLDDETEIAFIFNPILSAEELLRSINEDFGIASKAESVKALIDELNEYLLQRATEGKNCVLVIDEAQNLDPKVLEQVRLLSNLETETQKLLQIVLIGQPELGQMLATPELRQLNQRITARYHLKELDANEALHYIAFRLRVAGGRQKVRFSRAAVMKVYRHSKGTPRVINAVCDRALLIGYTKETREITPALVKQAINEIRGEKLKVAKRKEPSRLRPIYATVGGLALAGVLGVMVGAGFFSSTPPENSPPPAARVVASFPESKVAEAAPVPIAPTPEPVEEPPEEVVVEEPMDLESVLGRYSAGETNRAALGAIVSAWGLVAPETYPAAGDDAALEGFARENGFAFLKLQATLDQLKAINLPAHVLVRAGDETRPVALMGLQDAVVSVTGGDGEPDEFPLAQLASAYTGEAAFLWKAAEASSRNAVPWQSGPHVRALQAQLRRIGLTERKPNGNFDAPMIQLVRDVQRESGLDVDGVVGEHTRMVLASWDVDTPTPALSDVGVPAIVLARLTGNAAPITPEVPDRARAAEVPLVVEAESNDVPVVASIAPVAEPASEPIAAEVMDEDPAPPETEDPESLPALLDDAISALATESGPIESVPLEPAAPAERVESEELESPGPPVALLDADAEPRPRRVTPPADDHVPLIPREPKAAE